MSEPIPEPQDAPPADDWKPPASQEELNRIISDRLGREKAKYADYDDLKSKASEYDKLTESQKTEAQKLADQISAANGERDQAKQELDRARSDFERAKAAIKYGLTEDDLKLLQYVPADEVDDTAKSISERLNRTPDYDGGGRRSAPKAPNMNDLIRGAAGRG